MGGLTAGQLVVADAISLAIRFVDVFVGVYVLLIVAYILLSWVRLPYSSTVSHVQRFLHETCDPYLRLFRRIIPPLGPVDLSPIVAVFALVLAGRLVGGLLERIQ
jgi:uncharacterized protein YggT (Ycf19 family)